MSGDRTETDALASAARRAMDAKTKPPGSLGQLEHLACTMAVQQSTLQPRADPARIVVFAADHGVCAEGVSAFPAEVTMQMVHNFASGGAAVCVLARAAQASLEVVDVGVATTLPALPGVVSARVADGSANIRRENAMTHEQLDAALAAGREAVVRAAEAGVRCLALGEMGIGNTTPAAVITALFTGAGTAEVTGRGTGLDDRALAHKRAVVHDCIIRCAGCRDDPVAILRCAGGLEVAALTGAMLAAPAYRMSVVVDGYIVTAAALAAVAMKPAVRAHLLFSHRSAEPGHAYALDHLSATAILDMGLRLGEASAAALCIPLLRGAADILCDMATFGSAGVSAGESAT